MNVLIILACVFGGVFAMVMITERFGKPMPEKTQRKLSNIIPILVFVMIILAIIKAM